MNILIAGDVAPINSNKGMFLNGDFQKNVSDFESLFNKSDLFIANLECPLTDSNHKILKSGSSIKAESDTINGLHKFYVNLWSIANNHLGDFGPEGVRQTIKALEEKDLAFVGAGETINEARKPFLFKSKNKTVGVLSYSDYEFGMASESSPGANPFDTINAYEDLKKIKEKADFVIVLLHDGKEYYPYPSPQLQKVAKHLVSLGADVVVCQHSHIVGAVEIYDKGTIVYGQGNFLFDYRNNRSEQWSKGFFVSIDLKKDVKVELIPFRQNYPGITKLSEKEELDFHSEMGIMANKVKNADFISDNWNRFLQKQSATYLSTILGHNIFLSKVLKKTGLYKYGLSKKIALVLLNFFRSRVHRESIINILEEKTK